MFRTEGRQVNHVFSAIFGLFLGLQGYFSRLFLPLRPPDEFIHHREGIQRLVLLYAADIVW